jgi:hypothetical protein
MSLPYRSPTTRNRHPATSTRRANLSREHPQEPGETPGADDPDGPRKTRQSPGAYGVGYFWLIAAPSPESDVWFVQGPPAGKFQRATRKWRPQRPGPARTRLLPLAITP